MEKASVLKRQFVAALIAVLVALSVAVMATFAWYIYTVNAHTTNVHMAAGTSISLQISGTPDSGYGSATVLDAFVGTLDPVSTDRIGGGFQKVMGFTNGKENQPMLVANLFGAGEDNDYYMTSLYLRTNSGDMDVYLSDIGFEDSDPENPISTAIRIGIVEHATGDEYIFAISDLKNPGAEYNTATGQEGYVLDSTRTDGTTIPFQPYTVANFCGYDKLTGAVTLRPESVPVCMVRGSGQPGEFGEAVQLDIYIWLEGCDEDCTNNLCATTLSNIALSFAGVER